MSLLNKDENKTFGAVFRTPVENSKGIPHILEHSVLCGSKKYPIKEPFVELMKGSLNTFLNAFTYPDRTCYPVASTNLQVILLSLFIPQSVIDYQHGLISCSARRARCWSMSCSFSLSYVVVSDASALTADVTSNGFREGQLSMHQTGLLCMLPCILYIELCSEDFAVAQEWQLAAGLLQLGGCVPRCSAAAPLCD